MAEQVVGGSALGDDLEAGVLEQPRNALTQENRVVGEDYAHAAKTSTRGAERRKPGGKARNAELEQPLGLVDAGQLVLAEVVHFVCGVERVARPLGDEDLTAASRLRDSRGAVDVEAEVRIVTEIRLARVQAHADSQVDAVGPVVLGEGTLCRHRRVGGAGGVLEHDEELVASVIDDVAVAGLDALAQELAVIAEHLGVPVAEALQQLRRAFDIGEEKSDGAMR